MEFDVEIWLQEFTRKLFDEFSSRIKFVGLQGSYKRGEATENSDVDLVVILDKLSFEDLIESLHARQITDAALRRVLLHIVLHMKYYPFLEEAKDIPVPYARILGFSKTASPLLKEIRQNATLDIIQRPAEGKKLYSNSSAQAQIYSIDIRTADLYEQIAARKAGRKPISEYKRQQVIR